MPFVTTSLCSRQVLYDHISLSCWPRAIPTSNPLRPTLGRLEQELRRKKERALTGFPRSASATEGRPPSKYVSGSICTAIPCPVPIRREENLGRSTKVSSLFTSFPTFSGWLEKKSVIRPIAAHLTCYALLGKEYLLSNFSKLLLRMRCNSIDCFDKNS